MKNLKKVLLTTIFLPLTLGSASVLAFGGNGNRNCDNFDGPQMGRAMHQPPMDGRHQESGSRFGGFNGYLYDQLDLTKAQKQEIGKILQENRGLRRDFRGENRYEMQGYHQQMRDLTLVENMDENAVRALAQKMTSQQIDREVAHARVQNKIYNVLTVAQKTKLKDLQKDHEKRRLEGMQNRIEQLQRQIKDMKK